MPKRAAGPCTSIALCPASRSNEASLVQPFVRATARYDLQRVVDAISTIGGDDIELERWHGQLRSGVRAQLGPMIQFTMSGGYLSFFRPGVSAWEARAFLTARFSAQMSGYGPGRGSAALNQRLGVSAHDRCRRHHQSCWASRCRMRTRSGVTLHGDEPAREAAIAAFARSWRTILMTTRTSPADSLPLRDYERAITLVSGGTYGRNQGRPVLRSS
jgi:hypothetical protein